MVIVYCFVLHHIYRGNKNRWLTWVVCLLMLSQIGLVIYGYAWFKFRVRKELTIFNAYLYGLSYGVFSVGFNLPHYMLAARYSDMSKRVPAVLDNK